MWEGVVLLLPSKFKTYFVLLRLNKQQKLLLVQTVF